MEIRRLTIEDYDSLVGLWRAAGLKYRPAGRDSRASVAKELAAQGSLKLAAFDNGTLVGTALGSHDHRKGWINRLAVHPDWRRRGVARALIDAVEAELERLNLPVFTVLIEKSNAASLALFEQLGYSRDDEIAYLAKRPSPDV